MPRLQNGDLLPSFNIDTIDDGRLSLPRDLQRQFGVVLLYRGSWCPYCNAQLAAFVRAREQLDELGIRVVATSVDDAETTRATAERRRIGFPLGYGADAKALAELTGAYLGGQGRYLESTGFVLDPQGRIITAVYSSNAIGRLLPDDVIGLVKYLRQAA